MAEKAEGKDYILDSFGAITVVGLYIGEEDGIFTIPVWRPRFEGNGRENLVSWTNIKSLGEFRYWTKAACRPRGQI